ncbi:MAG TPA: hypothetical protein VES19_12720 [Candidatus Limnocylindrales bacterium]|nr:hypothetical protein [Candidatus Limnocylindrales bacterium]
MMLWARLTWQAKDPSALAGELAHRLLVPARPGGLVPGARLLRLGTCELEVRPWIREGPGDDPRHAGRLMLEPVPDGEDGPGPAPAPALDPLVLIGLGWSTVELDRAEADLQMWLGPPPGGIAAVDEHLGARARLRGGAGLPGAWTVLLEPSTEGRAAASLARDGEGPCALYLRPAAGLDPWVEAARERGVTVSARREGPFGEQVLLASGPSGPHVIVTEGRSPVSGAAPAGTIAS